MSYCLILVRLELCISTDGRSHMLKEPDLGDEPLQDTDPDLNLLSSYTSYPCHYNSEHQLVNMSQGIKEYYKISKLFMAT